MNRPAISTLALLLAASGLAATGGPSSATDQTVRRVVVQATAVAGPRPIRPAKIGRARIGMTVKQAMATGQFNKNVPNPPCGPIKLQPKKPYKRQYVVFVADRRIVEMDAGGGKLETPTGVRNGSTYRQVKRAYGKALSKPREVGYAQWGAYVHTGPRGDDRKWLGFLFGEALVDDGPLAKSDTVTLMGVTKGARPQLALDGC